MTNPKIIDESFKKTKIKYDIIIDDSTHIFEHQINVINECFKYLNKDGILIIEDIYKNDDTPELPIKDHLQRMSRFILDELQLALSKMAMNRCPDDQGLVLEMIKYGGDNLHQTFLALINELIDRGSMDERWRRSLFIMIPRLVIFRSQRITDQLQSFQASSKVSPGCYTDVFFLCLRDSRNHGNSP